MRPRAGGQESAGIATYDHEAGHIQCHKGMGLVSYIFKEEEIALLRGTTAIGHTRYSTAGGSNAMSAQPFVLDTDLGMLAIAHNGQVAKAKELRTAVLGAGVGLFTKSDSEVIAQMLARPHTQDPALAAKLLREDRVRKESIASTSEAAQSLSLTMPGSPTVRSVAVRRVSLRLRSPCAHLSFVQV